VSEADTLIRRLIESGRAARRIFSLKIHWHTWLAEGDTEGKTRLYSLRKNALDNEGLSA
jgi:hypothetical protein